MFDKWTKHWRWRTQINYQVNGISLSTMINITHKQNGIMIATVNYSHTMNGLQLGFNNNGSETNGVQVALTINETEKNEGFTNRSSQ